MMKRRIMLLVIFICAAFLVTLAIQYSTQAQQAQDTGARGGRQGGREDRQSGRGARPSMGQSVPRMLPLEAWWAHMSFQMNVSDEALVKGRDIFQKSWNERTALMKKMGESDASDREAMREAMQGARSTIEGIRSKMDEKLKDVLTPEQLEKFSKYQKAYQERAESSRRPTGGGRRPQGEGGGGRSRGGDEEQ